ncbi:carbohydrate kinase family protein [bacterium]|nr:carbohydrate kinase family protein [bacterium]
MKILAMTVCCMDVYPQNNMTCVGGNSVNFATQCMRSGASRAAVLGCVGADAYGAAIRNHLEKHTIDHSHLHTADGATAHNMIYISESGERFFRPDSWCGGVYQTFRLSDADWKFVNAHDLVAMPSVDPNFPDALSHLAHSGKLVVDFLDRHDFAMMEVVIPAAALAFISGDSRVVTRLAALSRTTGTPVIVTHGSEGSTALVNGELVRQKAIPVDTVVDTTGCGDAYQAAFVISWFAARDVKAAMAAGAVAAARVLTRHGGV